MTGYISDLLPGMLFTAYGERWEYEGNDGDGLLCLRVRDGLGKYFDPDEEVYDIVDPYA